MTLQSDFASLAREGGRGALVTVLQGPGAGGRLLVRADGSSEGSLGEGLDEVALRHAEELMWDERSEAREEGESLLFVDVVHPAPRVIIFGAVDYAADLCTYARATGWRSYVVDPRGRFATRERFPDADDAVLVNTAGHVTETTRANIAIRSDGRWVTPPLTDGLLPGCERRALLADGTLEEASFGIEDLEGAESVVFLNSVRGWRRAVLG